MAESSGETTLRKVILGHAPQHAGLIPDKITRFPIGGPFGWVLPDLGLHGMILLRLLEIQAILPPTSTWVSMREYDFKWLPNGYCEWLPTPTRQR